MAKLKLQTHYGFHELFQFEYVGQYKYDGTLWRKTVIYVFGCGQSRTQFIWCLCRSFFHIVKFKKKFTRKLNLVYRWKEQGNDIVIPDFTLFCSFTKSTTEVFNVQGALPSMVHGHTFRFVISSPLSTIEMVPLFILGAVPNTHYWTMLCKDTVDSTHSLGDVRCWQR